MWLTESKATGLAIDQYWSVDENRGIDSLDEFGAFAFTQYPAPSAHARGGLRAEK